MKGQRLSIRCRTASPCSCLLGLELSIRVNFDVLDERVELLLGVFVLVSLAGNADADLARDVSDASGPDGAVHVGVDADILNSKSES